MPVCYYYVVTGFFVILIRAALVILILVGMIVVLLGIHHYGPGGKQLLNDSDTDKLRSEMKSDARAMTDHNLFHEFLIRNKNSSRSVPGRK